MEYRNENPHRYTVRNAVLEDCQGILNIVNEAISNSTALYDYNPQTLESRQQWFEEKRMTGCPVIVADAEGTIAGFASYGSFRARAAYQYTVEHSVYVHPEFRKRGIARRLLTDLIRIATQNKVHTMIGGIDAENKISLDLHQSFGFEKQGYLHQVGYKFGRWLDLVFMQLLLKNDLQPSDQSDDADR